MDPRTHETAGCPLSAEPLYVQGVTMTERAPTPPIWEERSEILEFAFGPFSLGKVSFRALSLASNPFIVGSELRVPIAETAAKGCLGVVNHAVFIGKNFPTFCFDHQVLRYAPRYGERYVVDLDRPFTEYLNKFSAKSRNTLKRKVKKVNHTNRQVSTIQEYRTPSEIKAFRDIAITISHRSYKRELGWGFREDRGFARQLEADASVDLVRGYVLSVDDEPAAYVFCRIDHDVIVYKHLAHDERFTQRSPGTVLLYLMLERLCTQSEFRLLDFDGLERYGYKEFFATRAVRCARVVWFRPTIRSIAIFGAHFVLMSLWRFASALRHCLERKRHNWASARRLAGVATR